LLGLEARLPVGSLASSKALLDSPVLRFAPSFPPDWKDVRIQNIRVGKSNFDLRYERNLGGITLSVERAEGPTCVIEFAPQLEAGAEVEQKLPLLIKIEKNAKAKLAVFEGTWIELPREPLQIGQRSQQLRILAESLEENRFIFVCEGVGGRRYDVILHSPDEVVSVDGGEMLPSEKAEIIRLRFTGTSGEYERREVAVNLER
jgi:hypothetical protein